MYSVKYDSTGQWRYLNYREENALAKMDGALAQNSHIIGNSAGTLNAFPTIPINATSCRKMFYGCTRLSDLDISSFDMEEKVGTRDMFGYCNALKHLKVNHSFSPVPEMSLSKGVKIIVVPSTIAKGVNNTMNTEIHFNNVEDAIDTVMKDQFCRGITDVSELVDKAVESNEAITKSINTS